VNSLQGINEGEDNCEAIAKLSLDWGLTVPSSLIPSVANIAASFETTKKLKAVDDEGSVYIAEYRNHRIQKITKPGVVITFAGSGVEGFSDGESLKAKFNYPTGIALDSSGNLFVADSWNHKIRKVNQQGIVSTIAGAGTAGYLDGKGDEAMFYCPEGVALDSDGNVYVADSCNHRIRKINQQGEVSTLAGNGKQGYVDGVGSQVMFYWPRGIVLDSEGNAFVTDQWNNRIRKITKQGEVSTLAGVGARDILNRPCGIVLDAKGNLYVADECNHRIRKITQQGEIITIAGSGKQGFSDGGGSNVMFNNPWGITMDKEGNLFVSDRDNNKIRKIC